MQGTGGGRGVWAVAMTVPHGEPSFGEPRRLFTVKPDVEDPAPAADHSRFLALVRPVSVSEPPMRLVLGWKPGGRR